MVTLPRPLGMTACARKVDIRLPGKGSSNLHGARPVHQIIAIMQWIRTSRLSTKKSLSLSWQHADEAVAAPGQRNPLGPGGASWQQECCHLGPGVGRVKGVP